MDDGNFVESVSGWETSEACRDEESTNKQGRRKRNRDGENEQGRWTDRWKNRDTKEIKDGIDKRDYKSRQLYRERGGSINSPSFPMIGESLIADEITAVVN